MGAASHSALSLTPPKTINLSCSTEDAWHRTFTCFILGNGQVKA